MLSNLNTRVFRKVSGKVQNMFRHIGAVEAVNKIELRAQLKEAFGVLSK